MADAVCIPSGRILSTRANAFSVESLISSAEGGEVTVDGAVKTTALNEGENIIYIYIYIVARV